jgi:dethiobiotin synthase
MTTPESPTTPTVPVAGSITDLPPALRPTVVITPSGDGFKVVPRPPTSDSAPLTLAALPLRPASPAQPPATPGHAAPAAPTPAATTVDPPAHAATTVDPPTHAATEHAVTAAPATAAPEHASTAEPAVVDASAVALAEPAAAPTAVAVAEPLSPEPSATDLDPDATAPPVEPPPSPDKGDEKPTSPHPDAPISPAPVGPALTPDEAAPDDLPLTAEELPTGEALSAEIATELEAQAPQPAPQRPDSGEWRGVVIVTGTDTDVGKTIVTAAIAAAAQASGLRVAVIKPGQTGIATGAPTDIDVVTRLAAPDTTRVLAEYPEPMAPLAAATVAEMPALELYDVVDAIRGEADKHDLVLVEGAGGLLVPMGVRPSGEPWTIADLAITLGVKTVVVARAGLGTLNHTALTLEALSRRGVPAGVVIGAWPADPELVHWANLSDLLPHLVGALPEGAGAMDPGVFRRSAPGWLTPPLYGVIDNWRVWAEETDGHQ